MLNKTSKCSSVTHAVRIGVLVSSAVVLTACSDSDTTGVDPLQDAGSTTAAPEDPGSTNPGDAAGAPDNVAVSIPGETRTTVIGEVLVSGPRNRTLYTFANDDEGVSNCIGGCAETWPPVLSNRENSYGAFETIQRDDSSLQWTFKGSPLYYYTGDAGEGEINGEGLGAVWYVARPDPIAIGETSLGEVLTARGTSNAGQGDAALRFDYEGRTLYVFANDTANASNCADGCATNWPPLYADSAAVSAGDYSVLTRDDGTTQWAYKTQPLYFYIGDNAVGDTTGDGVGGVWAAAKP